MTRTAATSNEMPAASITSSQRGGPAGVSGRGSGRFTVVVDHGRARRPSPPELADGPMIDQARGMTTLAAGTGVTSEVGQLRTVLLHRPGAELRRLTPRNNDQLLFDGVPWVARAQEEHDAFAAALTDRGVEVLHLDRLLAEVMGVPAARDDVIAAAVDDPRLGATLRHATTAHLAGLAPADLATALITGVAHDELRGGRGLAYQLMSRGEFVVPPLPNLMFTRDSSVWVGNEVAVTSLAMPARDRESALTAALYAHHPRFAGAGRLYGPHLEHLEGGDVLLLAPGVLAVGVGERTTAGGAERLARRVFARGLAHTVLVVPIAQERATMHLDTICTMVDVDAMVMYPAVADHLQAWTVTAPELPDDEDTTELSVQGPQPFVVAAAAAMGIDRLRVIDTGLDPVTAEREQWDDGNNTLALAPRLAVAYERNTVTNAALEAAGIEVLAIAGSELGSGRGGPRCMSCPVLRDPL
jgi:arginine deiminase